MASIHPVLRHKLIHQRLLPATLLATALGFSAGSSAQLTIFETAGITTGNDPVECQDQGSYRICESDANAERILSHDGQPVAERTPLDFQLLLPPVPGAGNDGMYPLVVFIHGWNGHKNSIGGSVESEIIPYAEAGYAVLAYSARGWGNSCGGATRENPGCENGWNHLADARYEVRDTQYIAGLLADELSDDGTPLVDPQRIGVTGVSYGGGQSTILTSLRNRVVETDGTVNPWTSPAGKPMQIAAAAPYWAWTDLSYSLLPNGRTLDYVSNNSYFGPLGPAHHYPMGVMKTSYVAGLYGTGQAGSHYGNAALGEEPPLDQWYALINAGEPYTDATHKPIAAEIVNYHSGYYWLDPSVAPAPTLFNSGWSDDLFPVSEPLRYIHAANVMHPGVPVGLFASNYGHARASSVDGPESRVRARAWFDYYLRGVGPEPGPAINAKVQDCDGTGAPVYGGASWSELSPGELRLQDAAGGLITDTVGPSGQASTSFDPISGGNACTRVADASVAGALSYDFPSPDSGGYTVLGSATIIADIDFTGAEVKDAVLVGRLLDIAPDGSARLLARGVLRPDFIGQQVFQLTPIAAEVPDNHHLQIQLMGHEAPTHRQSNSSYVLNISNVELRIPVADFPDGNQIEPPAEKILPPALELAGATVLQVPLPAAALLLLALSLLLVGRRVYPNA